MRALFPKLLAKLSFKKKGVSPVGMDAGAYSVKLATLSKRTFPLEFKDLQWHSASNADAIKTSIQERGMTLSKTAVAIRDEHTEVIEIKLPKIPAREIPQAVDWELKKRLPQLEELCYDVVTASRPSSVEVQCITAKKEMVQTQYSGVEELGLTPYSLEPESNALMALAEVQNKARSTASFAVIDLGYTSFRILFFDRGSLILSRNLYFGLATLSHQIASNSSFTQNDVTELLNEFPADAAKGSPLMVMLDRSLKELLYTLCEEFEQSQRLVRDKGSFAEVTDVLLCGGGACLSPAVEYLQNHLENKQVTVLNPFEGATLPQGINPKTGPLWACAVGLALRD